jgi:hypothetical protein
MTALVQAVLMTRSKVCYSEQVAQRRVFINRNMQVATPDRNVRKPRRVAHLCERPPTRQRMRDESMPPVVDRERAEALLPQHLAGRQKPSPNRRPLQPAAHSIPLDRANERFAFPRPLCRSHRLPRLQIGQPPGIPPQRHPAALLPLRVALQPQVRPSPSTTTSPTASFLISLTRSPQRQNPSLVHVPV